MSKKPQVTDLTYEQVLAVIKEVSALSPASIKTITIDEHYSRLQEMVKSEDDTSSSVLSTLIKETLKDMVYKIVQYNCQLAEVQEAIHKKEVIGLAKKATKEEQSQIIDIITKVAGLGHQRRMAEQQNKKGLASKLDADIKTLTNATKDNETVTVITQIFPTIADFDGYADKMVEVNKKQWANIINSYE